MKRYKLHIQGKGEPSKIHNSLEEAEKELERLRRTGQIKQGNDIFIYTVKRHYKAHLSLNKVGKDTE